jgi:hypothetical protein
MLQGQQPTSASIRDLKRANALMFSASDNAGAENSFSS